MQLFVLDFNDDIPFEEISKRAKIYDLPILFAYETLASSNQDRFRIGFLNNASVRYLKVAETMLEALLTIFPEADSRSRDITQTFIGGKKLLYCDGVMPTINIESLFRNLALYLRNRYGDTNYKKKIIEFSKTTGIGLNKRNLFDVTLMEDPSNGNNNFSPNSTIIYDIHFGENLLKQHYVISFSDNNSASTREVKNNGSAIHLQYRSNVLNDISSNCQLFQDFTSGNRKLNNDELLSMATNLVQIESGASRFKDILKSNSYFDDLPVLYANWAYYLSYIKGCNVISCNRFCPYQDTCSHGTNILSTSKVKYHQMGKLANYAEHYVSIKEAEEDLKQKLDNAMNAEKKMWYIIKAQTSIGKTETYLKLIKDSSQRVLIAVPTNTLKQEVYERAKEMGIEIITSPSMHELKGELSAIVWDDIQNLYNSGRSVIPYLKQKIKSDDPECSRLFRNYLRELDAFTKFDGHAITTHKRLLTMDVSKYDLVIIDEDIIFNSIVPNKTDVTISDLKRLKKKTVPGSTIFKKINQVIKHSQKDEFFTLPVIDYDKANDGKPMGVDVPSFCEATHFCFRKASDKKDNLEKDSVTFLNPVKFMKDTKYIMLSATVNQTICEYYIGKDNMKFCECSMAKYKGTLNQYYGKSMSRACIDEDITLLQKIKNWSGFKYTITFLKHHMGDLHFGNTAGCDFMKGENIDVIGTPHQAEWIYKLFAYAIGLDFDINAKIKPSVTVEHNGHRCRLPAYDDEILKAIQFYMIEYELEQSIGRARLLRCDCIVNLFSNFPLRQAIMKESEYDKDDQQ
jgi:hypothetical protein